MAVTTALIAAVVLLVYKRSPTTIALITVIVFGIVGSIIKVLISLTHIEEDLYTLRQHITERHEEPE